MHGVMCIGKRVNAEVSNYDLRDWIMKWIGKLKIY